MSRYTIQLNRLIKSGFDLGLDDYPIFDENHRKPLNDKIINHYYYNEIGLETPALFRHFLNSKMREIMPYYNELFESAALEFDPLETFNKEINETYNTNNTGTTESHGNGTNTGNGSSNNYSQNQSNGKNVFSDTPQGLLSETAIEGETYATNATITTDGNEERGNASYNNSTQYSDNNMTTVNGEQHSGRKRTEKGKDGTKSYSELLKQYRETLLNIDMMIIEELSPLFMGVF